MEMSNIHSNVTDFAQVVTLIRQAQYDVFKVANTKLIELYWQLGRIISERVASAKWGKGVVSDMANYIAHLKGYKLPHIKAKFKESFSIRPNTLYENIKQNNPQGYVYGSESE